MTSVETLTIIFLFIAFIFTAIGLYNKNTNVICKSKRRLDGKTAIVTGGTSGMGLEIAIDFADRGAKVIVACPFRSEGETAEKLIRNQTRNDKVFFKLLDLASFASVRQFANDILNKEERLDILVNNAGIGAAPKPDAITEDKLNFLIQVNYFGHFLLTLLLLPLLKKSGTPTDKSRIVNIASVLHNVAKIDANNLNKVIYYPCWPFLQNYPNSKAFFIMFTRELSDRLRDANVVVNSVDPGVVGSMIFQTVAFWGVLFIDLFKFMAKNTWEGAQIGIHTAVDERAGEVSGKHFKSCKVIQPNKLVCDNTLTKKVWTESVRLVGISEDELKLADVGI